MEEDEEVILENSSVHCHLRDVGFQDVETKPAQQTVPCRQAIFTKEIIDNDIFKEILILKKANLLFEDDLDHVDCVLANFEKSKHESLRFMFKGTTSVIVLTLGLCFYIYLGSYAFLLVSLFYAYRTSEYLWQKHRRLKLLSKLIFTTQSNFSLFNKVMKFLYENENMLRTRFHDKPSHKAFEFLEMFKSDFICLQRNINNVFSDATRSLVKELPLCDYVDNPNNYICLRMNDYLSYDSICQLYNMYMLLQSQFFTRLIFSLVPNLVSRSGNSYAVVSKVLVKVTVRLQEVQSLLSKKLKFAMLNGICTDKNKEPRPLPKNKRHKDVSTEDLERNIHELSNSLQYSLIKARELESCIEVEVAVNAEQELSAIHSELRSCQTHIEEILIMQKKLKFKREKNMALEEKADLDIVDAKTIEVKDIGYSSLDPVVDDDVFVAVTDSVPYEEDESLWETEEVDPLRRKKHKEMLGELKIKLKQQAEDWERRESMVLARKGLLPFEESKILHEDLSERYSEVDLSCTLRKRNKIDHGDYGDESSEDELQPNARLFITKNGERDSLLAEALQHIGGNLTPKCLDEENFTCSGENSDIDT